MSMRGVWWVGNLAPPGACLCCIADPGLAPWVSVCRAYGAEYRRDGKWRSWKIGEFRFGAQKRRQSRRIHS